MNKDPLRSLSRGIVDAVERSPAFVAMTEGNGVVPMSWGNLGSQLVKLGIVEPSVDAVCDFFQSNPKILEIQRS